MTDPSSGAVPELDCLDFRVEACAALAVIRLLHVSDLSGF